MNSVGRYLDVINAIRLIGSMLVFFVALFGFGHNIFSRIDRKQSDDGNANGRDRGRRTR